MRVVILGENKSVHVQKWIRAIASYHEIELHVITFDRGVKYDNVIYHPLKTFLGNKLDYFLNAPIVKKYIQEIKPDLVQSHYASSYGFLGAYAGFHPYIITGWGADIFDSPKNILMKYLLQYSFRRADAITVLTEITRKEMLKLSDKYVHLIPFGVDLEKFKPNSQKVDSKIIRIGTIRTLTEKYGVEYLIRAFAKLASGNNNLHLDIVGDGPLRTQFENLAIELSIEKQVTFYGFVNQNSNFDYYYSLLSNFDIFVIPSILDSETFGVAAVEASACGIPVIASNVGGLPDVITDQVTGIIVPPKDVDSLSNALKIMIDDYALRNKLGINGREKAERVYNWKNNSDSMVSLYKQLVNKKE